MLCGGGCLSRSQRGGADAERGAGGIYSGGVVRDCADFPTGRREESGESGGRHNGVCRPCGSLYCWTGEREESAALACAFFGYRVVCAGLCRRFWRASGGDLCPLRGVGLPGYGADHVCHDGTGSGL